MLRTFAFAAAATTALTAPAFAGDLAPVVAEPAPMAPAPVVAPTYGRDWTGGYGGISLGYGDFDAAGITDDGLVYGAHAGYDYDFGRFVMGGEFDIQGTELSPAGVDIDTLMRLKIRAGYDAGPALLYAVGGAVRADGTGGSEDGYVAGAGVEYMMTDSVSIGGEYLYHRFDNSIAPGVDADINTLSARVNYRF